LPFIALNAKRSTPKLRPLQPPFQQQAAEAEHGDNFRHLPERHPRAGVHQAQSAQVRRSVRIKARERNTEEGRGNEHNSMIAILQERKRVQPQPLAPRQMLR
jgi:hypothetical protein